jgi:acyl-CoA thioester hydrolase
VAAFLSASEVRVRYEETDQMGVVHHAKYINWFEVGRTDLLRKLGTDYREVEQEGLLLPVLHVDCTYKVPARYDDIIVIHTGLSSYSGVKLSFAYDIRRGDEVLASGKTYHCWTNKDLKPIPLRSVWPELHASIDALYKGHIHKL